MKTLNKKGDFPYLYIYGELRKKYKYVKYISPKKILEVMRRIIRTPGIHDYRMIKEMCDSKFLKRINHQKYQILKVPYDYQKRIDQSRHRDSWP